MTDVVTLLQELRSISTDEPGVNRPALSSKDIQARRWLIKQMSNAGLTAGIDAVGNVYASDPLANQTVLVGSHADSVPFGGWLDGPLGIAYGIVAAREWREQNPQSPLGIDVIAFSDEEGRYLPCLGSKVFTGDLAFNDISQLSFAGQTFAQAAQSEGLPGPDTLHCLLKDRHLAFAEAHIEQGPVLDSLNEDLGIVTGIVGIKRYTLVFSGQANHAGTTPMAMRADAGMTAASFVVECNALLQATKAPDSVWNFGQLTFEPGVANVVPRIARLSIEIRDLSTDVLQRMHQAINQLVEQFNNRPPVTLTLTQTADLTPSLMSPALMQAFEETIKPMGAAYRTMPSGAIHDAMVLANHIPTGMLFIPSIKGKSHTPAEDTSERHINLGYQAFRDTLFAWLRSKA